MQGCLTNGKIGLNLRFSHRTHSRSKQVAIGWILALRSFWSTFETRIGPCRDVQHGYEWMQVRLVSCAARFMPGGGKMCSLSTSRRVCVWCGMAAVFLGRRTLWRASDCAVVRKHEAPSQGSFYSRLCRKDSPVGTTTEEDIHEDTGILNLLKERLRAGRTEMMDASSRIPFSHSDLSEERGGAGGWVVIVTCCSKCAVRNCTF